MVVLQDPLLLAVMTGLLREAESWLLGVMVKEQMTEVGYRNHCR